LGCENILIADSTGCSPWELAKMNYGLRGVLLLLVLLAAPVAAAEPNMNFRCVGPFGRDASHAGLVKAFGSAQVSEDDVFYGGDTEKMTIVFPNEPQRTLLVSWRDKVKRRGLASVTIRAPSRWKVSGIGLGTSLSDLERINGGPFRLNPFEGDFGGDVIDWMGGRLPKLPDGCRVGASVAVDAARLGLMNHEPTTDELLSSDPGLRAATPRVGELYVSFPE
jgi:hypothetical protein